MSAAAKRTPGAGNCAGMDRSNAAMRAAAAMQLMGAVGVGIAAGAGTGIVTGLVGTAII